MEAEIKTKQDIYRSVVEILSTSFQLDPAVVKPEANLYTELDIDSIDAIDLLVKLQQRTGKRIQPEAFKSARTVQDVVDAVATLVTE
jgi:acyl carrier protein